MRIPSPFRDRPTSVELQLTPMIDCVFLLMIYFIWSSSFAIVEMTLPSELSAQLPAGAAASPTKPPPAEADFEQIVIRILWTGSGPTWTVNDSPVGSLVDLQTTLQSIANIKRDAPLVLDSDPQVPLGNVIDVFDLTRLEGFEKVQFAAEAN